MQKKIEMQWNGCKLHQNLDDKQQLYVKEGHFIKIKFESGMETQTKKS